MKNFQNKNLNILYVYNEGREEKINNFNNFSKDFFYYYFDLKQENYSVDFIEINKTNQEEFSKVFKFVEKLLRKLTSLPLYYSKLLTKTNQKKVKVADIIIFTNETTVFSFVIYFLRNKINSTKKVAFLMGITNYNSNLFQKIFKKNIIKFIFSKFDKLIFLSNSELEIASKNFKKYKQKFSHLPFVVDSEFWKSSNFDLKNNNEILFIGNDLNRDYQLIKELTYTLPELKFTIVSKNQTFENLDLDNVNLIKGDWRSGQFTDRDILRLYENAKICILPILETSQPSGQSVASQAMSVGVPVIITETTGFWDKKLFQDKKNILFIQENNINIWKKTLTDYFYDDLFLDKISANSKKTLQMNHEFNSIYEKYKHIIFNL